MTVARAADRRPAADARSEGLVERAVPRRVSLALFGKKEKDAPGGGEFLEAPPRPAVRPPEPAPPRSSSPAATTVGPTLRVKGEFQADEDVTVDGRVEGIVNLSRSLTVGKTGVVEADVRVFSLAVQGRVIGNVVAEQKVEIFPSGRIEGNIKSPKISIQEGAHFKGNVDMSATVVSTPAAEPPPLTPAPSGRVP